MGILIESTALSTEPDLRSSIAHAGQAGRECLKAAGRSPQDVGLLINAGVFRDDNMAEPGMATIIQKEVGINLDYCAGRIPATSFDLINSACGVLNAVQVASAFLTTKSVGRVLVVASDAHPSNEEVSDFPFLTMGAAMLLYESEEPHRGFGPIRTALADQEAPGIRAWVPRAKAAHHKLGLEIQPDYGERALAHAAALGRSFVAAEEVDLRRTLLVTSHPTPQFSGQLAEAIGVDAENVVAWSGSAKAPHSPALIWGYHMARQHGILDRYGSLLFVGVGSGLSAACALYRL